VARTKRIARSLSPGGAARRPDLDTALGTFSFMTWNAAYAKLLLIAFTAVSSKL
jgi:hypothetical protein